MIYKRKNREKSMLDFFEWDGEKKIAIVRNEHNVYVYYSVWYDYPTLWGDDFNYDPLDITLEVLNLIENL